MTSGSDQGEYEGVLDAASDWWSRMRGPDAEQHRSAFEQWLAADPRHRKSYSTLQDAWHLSAGFGETETGRNRSLERHWSPLGRTVPRVAVMAAAAAAAAILLVDFQRPISGTRAPQPVQAAMLVQTLVGEIRTLDLPDRSKVTLDTDSQIRVHYGLDARRVELVRGRARFDVRLDPARGFFVEAGDRLVTAPQGRFDTALLPQGVRVLAWGGTLDVRDRGTRYSEAVVFRVASGRSAIFSPGEKTPSVVGLASQRSAQWVAGMLVYEGSALSDVLADSNRYSRQHILLGDASLGQLRVTGTFRPLPLHALAASLAAALGLRVRTDPNGNPVLEPG